MIDVDIGGRMERIRLIGIDTPKTKDENSPSSATALKPPR